MRFFTYVQNDRGDENRRANGIFGSDIETEIDERLKDINFEYVCLGFDTAWNMLQTMANASQCFVYVDREGQVRIVRDDFEGNTAPESGVSITPSNSFSYNLPTMCHAIVNRVKIPYFMLEAIQPKDGEDGEKDEKFTIEEKDFEYDENSNVILNISLKNFYPKIEGIQLCEKGFDLKENISNSNLIITYNQIRVNMGNIKGTQYIKIKPKNGIKYKLVKGDISYDENTSQKHNGIVEFELKSGDMIFGKDKAEAVSKIIINKYCNGVSYIEAEWRGTPELRLGDKATSYSKKDKTPAEYECLSNDFSYNGGLKVKTKARKITAP